MHPVLFTIPLPKWPLPLALLFGLVAMVGLGVGVAAWRQRRVELASLGAVIAVGGGLAAFVLRSAAYVPQGIVVTTYGAFLAISLGAGFVLASGLAANDGLDRRTIEGAGWSAVAGGFVGGRLEHVLACPVGDISLLDSLALGSGGLGFQGALAGGLVAALVALRGKRGTALTWLDAAAPALALGVVVGRFGSYGAGSGFGRPLGEAAWAGLARLGTFPRWGSDTLGGQGSPAWVEHVLRGTIQPTALTSPAVHPVQLYLALAGVVVFVAVWLARRRHAFSGEVILTATLTEAALRFPIEILRDDPERWSVGPRLLAVDVLGVGLVVAAAAFVIGPSRSFTRPRHRRAAQVGVLGFAPLLWILLRTSGLGGFAVAPSVGQWLALATVVGAAAAWGPLAERA